MSRRCISQFALAFLQGSLEAAFKSLQLRDLLLDRQQLLVQKVLHVRTSRHMLGAKDQELPNFIQ